MTETWGQEGTAAFAGQSAANDAVTAGALLRRAREAAGLHIAALAVSLKVPVRKLEALEEDRWDVLPDAVFVRALACAVCRTLKVDPQPVLDRLPQTVAPRLIQDDEGINTPFRAPGDGAAPTLLNQLSKPVFLAVFALLLGALVLILLPSVQVGESLVDRGGSAANGPDSANPAPGQKPAAIDVSPANALPSLEAVVTQTALVTTAAASAAQREKPVAAANLAKPNTPAGAATGPATAASAAPQVTGVIVFRARIPSWVEVTDAKGEVPIRRLLAAGEATGASGALPLQVIVGRADSTEVRVRGKAFDLRPVSRDNVARFEVK